MSGFLRPVNDLCIDCNRAIDPCAERNYICWDAPKQEYRRECAKCHDKVKGFVMGRRDRSDSLIHGI